MINPNMPRNIGFRVETLFANNGGRVGRLKPNANGVYSGLPMMILGAETQQKTAYDVPSVIDQITNPETRFNKVFRANKLGGEWGHPVFVGLSDSEKIERLMTVQESNVCHLFTGLYTDKPSMDGTIILRADIKPTGPMGPILKEGLEDPMVNTAFSLRAYVDTKMQPNGVKYRTVRSLTTFDSVLASGFSSTDKANATGLALESLSGDHQGDYLEYEMTVMQDGNLVIDQLALEAFSNTDLNEIFGTANVAKIIQSRTFIEVDKSLAERFPTLYQRSVLHDYFKEV